MFLNKQLVLSAVLCVLLAGCATAPQVRPPAVPLQPGTYHIVGSGQTLYSISRAYDVSINDIMAANAIKNPNLIGVGERLLIPHAQQPLHIQPSVCVGLGPVEDIVGEKQYHVRWNRITVHHSATKEGNAGAFDRNHRRRGMGGLFYHFVIGNGTGSGDGEIEVGWRWRRQKEVNRKAEIEICLVGDFNRQQMSDAQYVSLAKLIKVLMNQYSIPVSRVRRHRDIPGLITECPGRNFPFNRLKEELRKP
ncbi:MAG: N-acetylmuramoyl-L-alanine amidase [Candidatus Omnitrophota bacterium]